MRPTPPFNPPPDAAAEPEVDGTVLRAEASRIVQLDEPSGVPAGPLVARCVMLAGGLRPSPLMAEAGRSVLGLHLTHHDRVLDAWVRGLQSLAADTRPLDLLVAWNSHCPRPDLRGDHGRVDVRLVQELDEFRGPGGTARDLCTDCDGEETVLVLEAARSFDGDLAALAAEHRRRDADATIVCERDGTPAGVYLIRARALMLAPARGFMDLKEQLLPRILRQGMDVQVTRLGRARSLPLGTRLQFLDAARAAAASNEAHRGEEDSIYWRRRPAPWRVVCEGATVDEQAVVLDSIVMPGATVAPGAIVARSILCPGARAEPGENIIDRIVAGPASPAPGAAS